MTHAGRILHVTVRQFSAQTFSVTIAALLLTGLGFGQMSITLSPPTGSPTTNTLVSGAGFAPDAEIDVYFDTTYVALVNANSSGSFSKVAIEVPGSAVPGVHWVSAEEVSTNTGAQSPFKVNTNWATFGFKPSGGRWNRYENELEPGTVSGLSLNWYLPTGGNVDSSPAVVNGVVYVGSADDNIYALNAATGAKLWSFTTGNSVESSPAVVNGVVYIGSDDGNLYALNAATGALKWSYFTFTAGDRTENTCPSCRTPAPVISAPAVVNGVVYFGSSNNNVYALNASTGDFLWSFATGNSVTSSPAVANGVVYVGSTDDNVYALNAATGAELWSYTTGNAVTSSPAVANGAVYIGSDDYNLYALNAATGALLWSFLTGPFSAPAVANGVVYIGSFNSNVYALNAATGAFLWSFHTGNLVDSSPAVANGVVYVGSVDKNVYALNAATGTELWSFTTRSFVNSSPAVVNGAVYIGSTDYNIYAFSLPEGEDTAPPLARPNLSSLHRDANQEVNKTASNN
jgi:outer membrane protein assembly factor BamB